MEINTSTPRVNQNFGAAIFFKIPADMQKVLKSDFIFNKIAQEQDIFVSASPKFKLSDPLGLRTPQASEKCRLSYEIKDSEFSRSNAIMTNNKFLAPMSEHIQTLLKKLTLERIASGVEM